MCVEQRWIVNKYDGSKHYVKCGHCEACRQEKAIERTNRVRTEFNSDRECVFVTLSYADAYVPYVKKDDLLAFLGDLNSCHEKGKEFVGCSDLPVYRDYHAQNSNHGLIVKKNSEPIRRVTFKDMEYYGKMFIPSDKDRNGKTDYLPDWYYFNNLHYVRRGKDYFHKDKLGVLNFKDVQDFLKRVGSNLKYKKYEKHYEVLYVGEYGGDYSRPHFHVLFSISPGDYELFKETILKSWSFSDHDRLTREVEPARDPCSYLASYVNSGEVLPEILSSAPPFRPMHKYSHGFGMSLGDFSFDAVQEAYDRGSLTYDVLVSEKGVTTWRSVPIPKYVVNRYFPKFKGFNRLTPDEIQDVCERPSTIKRYKWKCGLTDEDCEKIIKQQHNLKKRLGLDVQRWYNDYIRIYKNIHNRQYVEFMRASLKSVKFFDEWKYFYLNVSEYLQGVPVYLHPSKSRGLLCVRYLPDVSPTLSRLSFPDDFQLDCNRWVHNLRKHNKLLDAWNMYKKNRQLLSEIFKEKLKYG